MSETRRWRSPMIGRDRAEPNRTATPLELLFDLCFVVAVAQASAELHHGLAAGQAAPALLGYVMVFFAVWWAWMNFTWFASAYDTDDIPYRILTLVQIAGVLVLAAGVPAAFERLDYLTVTIGYTIMRSAGLGQWLRAGWEHPEGRRTAFRYAFAVGVCQVGWLVRLALAPPLGEIAFPVLVAAELAGPVWAEGTGRMTPWHPEHVAERFGLFTLIVLGESVLASTVAVQEAIATHGLSAGLLVVAGGGLLLVFGLWWTYFKRPAGEALRTSGWWAFVWGYAHYGVFASAAALGAGLQAAAETVNHASHLEPAGAAFAVGVPVAVYLALVGVLQSWMYRRRPVAVRLAGTAVLVLAAAAVSPVAGLPAAVLAMGLLVTAVISLDVLEAELRLRRGA
ncbi:MAG: low temperature requirement protein A [bacterium]|jgi:low temperature requirement protein LtrA|nr:low temperature requirement protein A [bacterium]